MEFLSLSVLLKPLRDFKAKKRRAQEEKLELEESVAHSQSDHCLAIDLHKENCLKVDSELSLSKNLQRLKMTLHQLKEISALKKQNQEDPPEQSNTQQGPSEHKKLRKHSSEHKDTNEIRLTVYLATLWIRLVDSLYNLTKSYHSIAKIRQRAKKVYPLKHKELCDSTEKYLDQWEKAKNYYTETKAEIVAIISEINTYLDNLWHKKVVRESVRREAAIAGKLNNKVVGARLSNKKNDLEVDFELPLSTNLQRLKMTLRQLEEISELRKQDKEDLPEHKKLKQYLPEHKDTGEINLTVYLVTLWIRLVDSLYNLTETYHSIEEVSERVKTISSPKNKDLCDSAENQLNQWQEAESYYTDTKTKASEIISEINTYLDNFWHAKEAALKRAEDALEKELTRRVEARRSSKP